MKTILLTFLVYSIVGTLLHFVYKLSKNNIVVGIFAAVNESVWEHIKILLTPIFVISMILYVTGHRINFSFILFVQSFLAIALIIIFYKIKVYFFGDDYGFINVISFYVVAFIISFVAYNLGDIYIPDFLNLISLFGNIIVLIMYLTFSIFPLKNELFLDPVTKTYGIDSSVKKSV